MKNFWYKSKPALILSPIIALFALGALIWALWTLVQVAFWPAIVVIAAIAVHVPGDEWASVRPQLAAQHVRGHQVLRTLAQIMRQTRAGALPIGGATGVQHIHKKTRVKRVFKYVISTYKIVG